MVWREPKKRHDDYCFCIVDMFGWKQKKKKDWCYPDIEVFLTTHTTMR